MSSQQNPYSAGYAAIVKALQNWPALTAIVAVGNIQSEQASGYRPKTNVQAADRPQILLSERKLGLNPFSRNSLGTFFQMIYPLEVASGQLGVDKINLVVWEVGRALTNAGYNLGLDFVMKWDIPNPADLKQQDKTAQRPDYTVLLAVRLDCGIRRAEYLANTYT